MKTLKKEAASRLSDAEIAEKDEIITDLRAEGESLSKQVGKHSEIIKKLRSKEKSNEKEIKNLKDKVEDKTKECERLNKSLEAKNEVESKQIEAIQNLTKVIIFPFKFSLICFQHLSSCCSNFFIFFPG